MNRFRRFAGWMLLLLLAATGQAQEVIYSTYEKFDLHTGDFSVIGKTGNRVYTYRSSSEGFFLDAYNDSMERTATVLLDFFPKKVYDTRFINYATQILVLYQAPESGKVVQYAALLDQAGRLLKGPIQISSVKTGLFAGDKDYFSSAISDDKKQILVYGIEEKGAELHFTGVWFDDQLGSLQRGYASFSTDNTLGHGEGMLDNNGNFYLPAYTPVGMKDFADQLWLLYLPRGSRVFGVSELPLHELFATSAFLKLDNAGNRFYLGGFYSDKKNGNYEGVLFARFRFADSNWENIKTIPFDESLRGASGERNTRTAFNSYQVKQMIIKKDGGFVMISEDFSVITRQNAPGWAGYYSVYNNPFMSQNVREYTYGDVFALSYDAEGNKEWHAFVHKNQYSQEDGGIFSSYGLINTGGTLGFLFNDFNTGNSRIQLATLDANGKVEMNALTARGSGDPDWLPRSGKQTGLREMVVPCLKRRQLCFAKIVF